MWVFKKQISKTDKPLKRLIKDREERQEILERKEDLNIDTEEI